MSPPASAGARLGPILPIVIGAAIIVGGLAFLFLYDAKSNRFTNAPDAPFETISIEVDAAVLAEAAISPDGKSLVIAAGDETNLDLFVRSVEIESAVTLTDNPAIERTPAWSPDGQRIGFTRRIDDTTSILTIPFRGGTEKLVASIQGEIGDLDWAGDEIYFSTRAGAREPWAIFSADVASGNLLRVTAPGEGYGDHWLAISPGGREIAFSRVDAAGRADLWVRDLRTAEDRRLTTEGAPIHGIAWGEKGIVYSVGDPAQATIWTISPLGMRGAELRTPPPVLAPTISDDGRRVLYRRPSGEIELVLQP